MRSEELVLLRYLPYTTAHSKDVDNAHEEDHSTENGMAFMVDRIYVHKVVIYTEHPQVFAPLVQNAMAAKIVQA